MRKPLPILAIILTILLIHFPIDLVFGGLYDIQQTLTWNVHQGPLSVFGWTRILIDGGPVLIIILAWWLYARALRRYNNGEGFPEPKEPKGGRITFPPDDPRVWPPRPRS